MATGGDDEHAVPRSGHLRSLKGLVGGEQHANDSPSRGPGAKAKGVKKQAFRSTTSI